MCKQAQSQVSTEEIKLLHKLDSISTSGSVSGYFAGLYFVTMTNAIRFFEYENDSSHANIRRMEARFAGYFFNSAEAYAGRQEIPTSWQAYYTDTSASPMRHLLLGVNAHLNGDLWQGMVASFSIKEIKALKPVYYSFYDGLLPIYEEVYRQVYSSNRSLKWLHIASFGLDKWYGKKLLHRWLKRQINLAGWYYTNPARFQRRLERLHRRMHRMDRMIRRHFW